MSIDPISGAIAGNQLGGVAAGPADVVRGGSFGEMLNDALTSVSDAERSADDLVRRLAAGENVELHEVTIATTEARLAVELLVAVRDQAVAAYNQIVNIQL